MLDNMTYWIENADSALLLPTLPAASVDALVTDPPAGIGFMGKEWDDFRRARNPADAGRDSVHGRLSRSGPEYGRRDRDHFIAWLAGILTECRRIMKPGAYGWVWAIPRTSHWTAMACEDAGFAVRDVMTHVFGCVPSDAEILTSRGWRKKDQIAVGEPVMQVDDHGCASLGALEAVSTYPFDGEMVSVATRSTHQLLTPGHSVHAYAKRNKWKRVEHDQTLSKLDAETFATADIPGVATWLLPLAARGTTRVDSTLGSTDIAALYGWIIAEGHFHADVAAVSIYQNEGSHADEIRGLLARLAVPYSEYRRTRTNCDGKARPCVQWYLHVGPWSTRIRRDLAGPKPTPPEWLAWLPEPEAKALFEALVSGDGSRQGAGRSGAWYQKRASVRAWFQTLCFRLGYRTIENESKSAISWCKTDTTEIGRNVHRRRACTRVQYKGEVWCPTVPQGRWVCRWRGSVFVTGNTGFPKSRSLLKPAAEHWILVKAPGELRELRIEENRIAGKPDKPGSIRATRHYDGHENQTGYELIPAPEPPVGRWPANFALSHSDDCADNCVEDCPVRLLDEQAGPLKSGSMGIVQRKRRQGNALGVFPATTKNIVTGDSGGASRFFYVAKASTKERSAGLPDRNSHPTVKSIALMRHLIRLIAAPGSLILDPFTGSGSTAVAALQEGCRFAGIERDPQYAETAQLRAQHALATHS